MFQKATKKRGLARIAIDGPSGSGKTYTALIAATALGGRISVIDTERGSASLYADKFGFDVCELDKFDPKSYIAAIHEAEAEGYNVIMIDSLSHAWEGEGGVLEMHDAATKRQKNENSYTAWRDVTPQHRALIDAMLRSKCHVIATMRSKMDYAIDEQTHKIKKLGMAPIQRPGTEYEFTIVADMDIDHNIVISKSRCETLADQTMLKPDAKFWQQLVDWLNSGDAPAPATAPATASGTTATKTAANATTAEKVMPTPAMWKKYVDLETEAHALGVETQSLSVDLTAVELSEAGKSLREKVNAANAAKAHVPQEQAGPDAGDGENLP